MKASLSFFIIFVIMLSFHEAFGVVQGVDVFGVPATVYQNQQFTINVHCISDYQTFLYQNDNGQDIGDYSSVNNYYNIDYSATGSLGEHQLLFHCKDYVGGTNVRAIYFKEISVPVQQSSPSVQSGQQQMSSVENNQQSQNSGIDLKFDNGLFLACLIVGAVITIFLIIALASGGWFRKPARLEPISPSYLPQQPTRRTTRRYVENGREVVENEESVRPDTDQLVQDILGNPVMTKKIVEEISKNPHIIDEINRQRQRNNLGRICFTCNSILRDENNELVHCELCCTNFKTSPDLDMHKCKSGMK